VKRSLIMVIALLALAVGALGVALANGGPAPIYLPLLLRTTPGGATPTPTPTPVGPTGMVLVPAGAFQMGCDMGNPSEFCYADEKPLHTVSLDAYYIDRTEITNAQYAQCATDANCTLPSRSDSSTRESYYGNAAYADYPVIQVDWHQASAYCQWVGKRLPTEAEWEKAARGSSDTRRFPWGNQAADCSRSNFDMAGTTGQCVGNTTAVGSYPSGASPYGALDMAGNVAEWVADWYDRTYYSTSPGSNPAGPASGSFKGLRGGAWYYTWYRVRVASRNSSLPSAGSDSVGFRCAAPAAGQ